MVSFFPFLFSLLWVVFKKKNDFKNFETPTGIKDLHKLHAHTQNKGKNSTYNHIGNFVSVAHFKGNYTFFPCLVVLALLFSSVKISFLLFWGKIPRFCILNTHSIILIAIRHYTSIATTTT